jgi:chlorite dismutase
MSESATDPNAVDVFEHGAPRDGAPQSMNRRLFMQLLVFHYQGDLPGHEVERNLYAELGKREATSVIYEDVNHPSGVAVLSWSEDPSDFVTKVRPALCGSELRGLVLRPEFTMFGRSYSSGYEDNLEYWLLKRPVDTGSILREHAVIGKRYGSQDLAHDVRLACHGLDANDNEFVIGLIGKELHPLSHVVQTMRGTRQTSEYIGQMGPFFVGRAVAPLP